MKRAWRMVALGTVFAGASARAQTTGQAKESNQLDAVAKARSLDRWGDRGAALRMLELRLAEAPNDVAARALYGRTLSRERRYDDARRELTVALRAARNDQVVVRELILIELQTAHPDRAWEIATAGLKTDPDNVDLLADRARASMMLWRLEEARVDLDRLLARAPDHAE
ncbi:MAG TPA: tetratricopeptide repeat protein, partial [Polyangiaceae bacterium]|nr:tetratricopeptide repeat protein [Polyangiaceae bacterium]